MEDTRKTYKIWIRKANVFDDGTHVEEQIVKTNDIYHEIGYIYCNTLGRIDRIDYKEIKEEYTIHLTDKQYRDVIELAQADIKRKIRQKIKDFKAVKQQILRNENKLSRASITYDIVRNDYCEKMLEELLKEE